MMDRLESFDNDELIQFVKEPRIQMLGIGGAGNNILTRLYRRGLGGVQTVAINTDAEARIFRSADLGLVGDYNDIIPLLITELRELKRDLAQGELHT